MSKYKERFKEISPGVHPAWELLFEGIDEILEKLDHPMIELKSDTPKCDCPNPREISSKLDALRYGGGSLYWACPVHGYTRI